MKTQEILPFLLYQKVGLENGVRYPLAARHRGIDPWLFLDLRAARRWVLHNSGGKEVLNLFSYTGGVGAAAACGGAARVWNVDFSASAHEVSEREGAGRAGRGAARGDEMTTFLETTGRGLFLFSFLAFCI